MNEATIYHIAQPQDLESARTNGFYSCASLAAEHFIHCCKRNQLAGVIERYYADATGLKLLTIDTDKLTADLVYENTVGGKELFPHVYGRINTDAIIDVSPLHDALQQ